MMLLERLWMRKIRKMAKIKCPHCVDGKVLWLVEDGEPYVTSCRTCLGSGFLVNKLLGD